MIKARTRPPGSATRPLAAEQASRSSPGTPTDYTTGGTCQGGGRSGGRARAAGIFEGTLEALLVARGVGRSAIVDAVDDRMPYFSPGHPVLSILRALRTAAAEGADLRVDAELGRLHGLLAGIDRRAPAASFLSESVRRDHGVAVRRAECRCRGQGEDGAQSNYESLIVGALLGQSLPPNAALRPGRRAVDIARDDRRRSHVNAEYIVEAKTIDAAGDDGDVSLAVGAALAALRGYLRDDRSPLRRSVLRATWRAILAGEHLTREQLAQRCGSRNREHVSRLRAELQRQLAARYRRELDRLSDLESSAGRVITERVKGSRRRSRGRASPCGNGQVRRPSARARSHQR